MEAASEPAQNYAQLPRQGEGATDCRDVISQILRDGTLACSPTVVNATADASYCKSQGTGSTEPAIKGFGNNAFFALKISALIVIAPGSLSSGRAAVDSSHGGCCVRSGC
jgi:hypothetical protein